MLFLVKRTSEPDETVPPCEEARQIPITAYDIREAASPEEIEYYRDYGVDKWYNEGGYYDHCVNEHGRIQRSYKLHVFVVNVEDMNELVAFLHKYGRMIISTDYSYGTGFPTLEIYDDYRE